jgi:hypothetical protein
MSNNFNSQVRLSMRLDAYWSDYSRKNVKKNPLYTDSWDQAWREADAARQEKTLTPELVNAVRLSLEKVQS